MCSFAFSVIRLYGVHGVWDLFFEIFGSLGCSGFGRFYR